MKHKFYSEKMLLCYAMTGLLLAVSFAATAQSPAWLWAKAIGGPSNDFGNSIALDGSGNIITTGCFSGTGDFDPGPAAFNLTSAGLNDIFIAKTDGSGNFLWAKRIGGMSNDFSWSATTDLAGNIIFTGYYNGTIDFDPGTATANLTSTGYADIFVCKLDSYGNFMWAKSMGGSDNDDYGYAVTTDAAGNVYTTGIFSGSSDFDPGTASYTLTSAGGPDIFLSKLTASGSFAWAKAIGGLDYENGFSISTDAADNVYATGYFTGTVDFNPGPAQTLYLTSSGSFDAFVMKFNASGDFQWAKRMGGPDDDFGSAITIDITGNVYNVGHFQGTADFDPGTGVCNLTSVGSADIYISKLNDSGNFIWAKSFGGTSYDDGFSIAADDMGNVFTSGRFVGVVDFDPGTYSFLLSAVGWGDIFVSKLNSSGDFQWAKAAGGLSDDVCKSMAFDATGHLLLTGNFSSSSIVFGPSVLSSASGTSDIFIAKLDNTATGISADESENTIFIYPNPVIDQFTIALPGNYRDAEISLTDLSGKKIPLSSAITFNGAAQEITVSLPQKGVASGIYFVRITTAEINLSQRLSIVR